MAQIILLYNLQDGVSRDTFHEWIRTIDYPKMRGLASVDSFRTFESKSLLMGDGAPTYQYVEVFDINDMGAFTGSDMPGETVQSVMGQFMGFAEAPEFIISEEVK